MVALDELPELSVYAPEFADDPHRHLREVRAKGSIARSERGLELLSYRDCEQVLRNPDFAVGFDEMMAATGITDGPAHETITGSINNTEGPAHTRLRKAIVPFLAPKQIGCLRGAVRETVEARLDSIEGSECDMVETIARWLPATAFCLITGAPLADRELIWKLSDHAQRFFEMKPLNREPVEDGLAEIEEYMDALLARRRAAPDDDILSFLLVAERRGELTGEEVRNLSMILLAASTDTTSGQLTYTFAALAEDQSSYRRLREDETLIGNAVLETARYRPGLWTAPRFARKGGRLNGLELPPGIQLNAFFLAANRDPDVFDQPDEMMIDRRLARPPLNWSSGRHFCPGRPLAVLEIEEAVRAAVRRWERIELVSPVESHGAPYIVSPIRATVRFVRADDRRRSR